MGVATSMVQTRQLPAISLQKSLRIETLFETVSATCHMTNDLLSVKQVECSGVPSFVHCHRSFKMEYVGDIEYDICFGGAYFLFVDLHRHNTTLSIEENKDALLRIAIALRESLVKQNAQLMNHPLSVQKLQLDSIVFCRELKKEHSHSIFKELVFDFSTLSEMPPGESLTARLALESSRQSIPVGGSVRIEGTSLSATVSEILPVWFNISNVVVPKIFGYADLTGKVSLHISSKKNLQGFK